MAEHSNEQSPPLSPGYQPATRDSTLFIRFIGNTAAPADAQLVGIDPFQLKAIAWWLERHADKMLAEAERQAASAGIRSTSEMPPGGTILSLDQLRGDR